MIRTALLAVAIVLLSGQARADVITNADCTKPQHAQMIINHCASLDFQAADKKLSDVYEKTRAALQQYKSDKTRFEAAEQAWLQYRGAQCAYEAGMYTGGSLYSMVYTTCAKRLTDARIKEQRSFLACHLRVGKCEE
jgi:uncharacterized protein YecT (DUF1311 family)